MFLRTMGLLLALAAGGGVAADDPKMGASPTADIDQCDAQCAATWGEACLARSTPDYCRGQRETCEAQCDDNDGDDAQGDDEDDRED